MRNPHIDRWIALATTPEVSGRLGMKGLPPTTNPDHLKQIIRDIRAKWIEGVFWNKAVPPNSETVFFPKLGIYEILCERQRVFDMQGTRLEPWPFRGFFPKEVSCASRLADGIPSGPIVSTHEFFDDALEMERLLSPKCGTMANRLWCLDWPSIQLGAEILIPNPSENLILENFEVADMEKELGV